MFVLKKKNTGGAARAWKEVRSVPTTFAFLSLHRRLRAREGTLGSS
jgi:hypothetical protein